MTDIIEEKVFREILTSFSSVTGLKVLVADIDGGTVFEAGGERSDCTFCTLIRDSSVGREKCRKSYTRAGREAAKWGEPYIFRCHAGLIGWAAPLILGDRHVATIVCGQVLMWEPEEFFWEELKSATQGLRIPFPRLCQAAKGLRVIPAAQVKAAADMLFMVANYMMKKGSVILDQRRRIAETQAALSQGLRSRKSAYPAIYSLKKEREMLSEVRQGNLVQAREALEALLDEDLERYVAQPAALRARVHQFLVLMARAAVEGGGDMERLLALNDRHFRELTRMQSTPEICSLLYQVLDECVAEAANQGRRHGRVLREVTTYLSENYHRPVNVEDVSRTVHLSPHYLSRLFKREYGCTIMEYLANARLSVAKDLLRDTLLPIREIARRVGFSDPGYFSKVFKALEGCTPGQFRDNCARCPGEPAKGEV
ncbi:MAG: PocR ligand-binding domain-containing protein [Bacillota bacterium]|jgi:two-component system response regulator YesN